MRSLALCVIVLLTAPVVADDKPKWQWFKPKDGKCAVDMPGKPVAKPVQEIKAGDETIKLHMFILEQDEGKIAYGLAYSDLPAGGEAKEVLKNEVLKNAQEGTKNKLDGKVLAERDLKLGEYQGREFTLDIGGGNHYRARLYAVDNRLYQVILVGSEDFVGSTEGRAFLYSFELTK